MELMVKVSSSGSSSGFWQSLKTNIKGVYSAHLRHCLKTLFKCL